MEGDDWCVQCQKKCAHRNVIIGDVKGKSWLHEITLVCETCGHNFGRQWRIRKSPQLESGCAESTSDTLEE